MSLPPSSPAPRPRQTRPPPPTAHPAPPPPAGLKGALDTVESIDGLKFAHSEQYGYVTSCPTNLGTGMRASVHLKCPNLTADGTDTICKATCKPLGLSVRGLGGEHTPIGADGTVDISPSARFCITEGEIVTSLYKARRASHCPGSNPNRGRVLPDPTHHPRRVPRPSPVAPSPAQGISLLVEKEKAAGKK